ncbi:MAG: hypothetical protein IJ912_03950 [Fibrobacter sp.]|nr:hypothetical protein [Fibrobacter sp.]
MFYKHWKKIALALTGFFWASCDDSASSAVCLYGPDPNYSDPAENPVSSSSEATGNETNSSSSVATEASSSSVEKTSSSSSNDFEKMVPLYGIEMDKTICTQVKGESTMQCDDGATCKQVTEERWAPEFPCSDEICPDYGVVQISENTYECDGVKYNEAQFRTRYEKLVIDDEPEQDSTFNGEMQPALYGPPCVFNGTCDDAEK